MEDRPIQISLTRESARLVRFERIVQSKPNPPAKAEARGYYDALLGLAQPEWVDFKLEKHYQAGFAKARGYRAVLSSRGLAWTEREISQDQSKWTWAVYREGYFVASGEAKSQKSAENCASEALMG